MSIILNQLAKIYDISREERTSFSADEAAAQTVLSAVNAQGFVKDDYIILGEPGEEKTELRKISSVSGNDITISAATSFIHKERDPITKVPYNQVKIYSSSTEDGTYTQISGSPFNMEVDQIYTYAVDASGTASTYYKFSWYNETTTGESSLSTARLAGSPDQLCTLEEVKNDLGIKLNVRDNDEKISETIPRITQEIINFTKVQFISKTISNEYPSEIHGDTVYPKYYPIYGTPTLVEDYGVELYYDTDVDLTDYHVYKGFIIKASGSFSKEPKRVKLSYVAWWGSIPDEIKQVAIEMVGVRAGLKTRTFVDAEGITQAVLLRSVPDELWDILKRYERKVI